MSSLPMGQGANAVQERFMYVLSREERRAAGFAELYKPLVDLLQPSARERERSTYFATLSLRVTRTAASSFTKCGRFPVFCS